MGLIDKEELKHKLVFTPLYSLQQVIQIVDEQPEVNAVPAAPNGIDDISTFVREYLAETVRALCRTCSRYDAETDRCKKCNKHLDADFPACVAFKAKGEGKK